MIEKLLETDDPYSLGHQQKNAILLEGLNQLTSQHVEKCLPYQRILDKTNKCSQVDSLEDVPYLPVQLFKMLDLFSGPDGEKFKTLTSSGTTGQQVSKIYIDKETSLLQTRALNVIMRSFLGKQRLPMMIVDTDIMKNRRQLSARTAGTIGFSQFGRKHFYLLDDEMNINEEELDSFLNEHQGQPLFLFGFTYIIWQYFYQAMKRINKKIDLTGSILVHGGGWKKMQDQAVDNEVFKSCLQEQFSITRIHNYYGMVEQVGSIFMECEAGYLHTPDFADVIVRNYETLEAEKIGEPGVLQVLSLLPKSYPGHSLLTEDVGVLFGVDSCSCGRKGKHFKVLGRIPKAEVRGCSDTFTP